MQWLATIRDAAGRRSSSIFAIDLPAILNRLARLLQRPGLAALRGGAQPAAALAGRGRPGLRLPGAVAGRAVAQGPAVRRPGPGASIFASYAEKRRLRRVGPRPAASAWPAGSAGGLLRRPRRQVPADLPLAAAGAPGRRAVPGLLRAGLLVGADRPELLRHPAHRLVGGHAVTLLGALGAGDQPAYRRAVRDAAAVPARGRLPALPGAVPAAGRRARPPDAGRRHRRSEAG